MKATKQEKSEFAAKNIARVASLLIILLVPVIYADENTAPHRTSHNLYLDSCKTVAAWGDLALSDDEYRATGKLLLEEINKNTLRTSLQSSGLLFSTLLQIGPVTHKEEYKQRLQRDVNNLAKIMQGYLAALISPCQEQENKKLCRLEKAELIQRVKIICKKWRRLKRQIKRLKMKNLDSGKIMRKLLLGEKYYSESNTIKQSVILKQKSLYSKYNRTLKRKHETTKLASRQRRAATARKDRLWQHGVIPFRIHENFSADDTALFKRAMRRWEKHTCITFKEKERTDRSSILFTVKPCGCCAYVGNQGYTDQAVSIGEGCNHFGTVLHELGHVVGFWHEHSRPDRDHHVVINYTNILRGEQYNFIKYNTGQVDSLGESYDFNSIMHYSRNTLSCNISLDTIVPIVPVVTNISYEFGQRIRLSPGDIRQTNKLYNCSACGDTFQNSKPTFHGSSRPGRSDFCKWRISVMPWEKIVLNITHLNISMSPNCSHYLEVRDGYYFMSPPLRRYCGDQIPGILTSTRNWLWMQSVTQNGGYVDLTASYKTICESQFMEDNGTFTSPDYPIAYPSRQTCTWRITVTDGFIVALNFTSFQLEDDTTCRFDFVEIYNGPTEASPLLLKYCGYERPDIIITSGNHMFVKFVSDQSVERSGFSATFISICGGELVGDNGTFTSLNYPDTYPPEKNCIWRITVTEGFIVALNFTHFELESHIWCRYDYVAVYDGPTEAAPLLGKYCGTPLSKHIPRPGIIRTIGNQMYVEFVCDRTMSMTGFSAVFFKDSP